ncbi:DHA2 family efflux MFS transporter permease subunit [Methanobacterium alcaliphilum]|uniref:DHA2 family efflux MFS transporter permease subunit n=1 Tax=Methanobacterium alcaliphilum TaxID=392018 RepID=UPI00200B1352|nr:DHA2 family efflux MFS transporter permease subunit [Methanobacterium alcaliphilum]MCK9150833.1 DHA2 family efflux MFS transporter permease subunit [Methanobacterium alcaliphilum]
MSESNQNLQQTAYDNRFIILGIVLMGILMSVLDGYMVSIALPTITSQLHVNVTESQWIVSGYLVVMTGLFIFFGKISEFIGKTKLFFIGWLIFTISSLACGVSTGITELILFRLIQALGASMVAGVSGAILFHTFPPNEIGRAMGYFGAVVALGSLIGPGLGGFITSSFGWEYIFLINVPIGIFLLISAIKFMKIPEIIEKHVEIDWLGAGLFVVSIVSLMLLCGEIAQNITFNGLWVLYGLIFAIGILAFIFQEKRSKNPMLDIKIFKNKKFTLPILSALFLAISVNMAIFIGPFYFQGVMGYNPLKVGLLFMFVPLSMMFAAPLGGKLYDKYHWKYAASVGAFIAAIAFALLAYAYWIENLSLIAVSFLLWGLGYGLFSSPNTTEAMIALPREKTAIASSVATTARSLGGALGVSLATVLLVIGLNTTNFNGSIIFTSSLALTNSIAVIMVVSGFLGLITTLTSALRNTGSVDELNIQKQETDISLELSKEKGLDD